MSGEFWTGYVVGVLCCLGINILLSLRDATRKVSPIHGDLSCECGHLDSKHLVFARSCMISNCACVRFHLMSDTARTVVKEEVAQRDRELMKQWGVKF